MTQELPPNSVFVASAKPESPTLPKQESKIVRGVKNTVNAWFDRIGTKNVEKHFVEAHGRVLATLDNNQRKEVFAREAEKWQKAGKRWGIAATVIDASLVGIGTLFTIEGVRVPQEALSSFIGYPYLLTPNRYKPRFEQFWSNRIPEIFMTGSTGDFLDKLTDAWQHEGPNITKYGKIFSGITGASTLGSLLTGGPGHWLAHLAAGAKESMGKTTARTHNCIDSGKAAEHAAKVGSALGKAATETAKFVAEHPDEIRKTVETVSRVNRQNAESKQRVADAALDAEYNDWIAHHPDKAYYENSGTPYPSKAEYVDMKKKQDAARKANKEAEERGASGN